MAVPTTGVHRLDDDAILERLDGLAGAYATAEPFPHVVVDDLVPAAWLREIVAEFPAPDAMTIQFHEPYSVKSAENEWRRLGPATQALITELNAPPFLQALQALTGIAN